ncbi:DnaD domain protein [Limosilactobacillus sp.]|uniref:DnaD domain protein n=1 Tax=Limosilactobacillus sp. TaxID=2773925 RepID=UPI0025BB28B1|nr:DnaD domain protein [Limosilactobacillus sp.]MCH3923104.1 DnaD domain protein [Limosilactobacillus sp.]MCH3927787.1 DnaD domain protein [Limosilactobacillus sp.]
MSNRQGFDPQAGYLVTSAVDFANFNERTFVDFYQPILGPVAFSLFYALRSQMMDRPTLADRRLQSELLVQLNAGQGMVAEGLQRLESSGMLITYHRHDAQGDVYVYELQATLTPTQFVADSLLSVLLLEEIGESRFNQLMRRAQAHRLADADSQLKDVSHHFLDTYRVDQREVVHLPHVIRDAQKQVQPAPAKEPRRVATDFDWPTLLQLLEGQPVIRDDLTAQRQLIEVEHQLYGIDEPEMARLIRLATDLASNHFDAQKFKQVVASRYQRVPGKQATVAQTKAAQSTPAVKGLTDKDRLLLKSTDNYAPVEFLQALKEQTGGYVTAGERNVLTRLVQDGQLPSSVINVLVWYVIADLGNATLKGNFVDAIANDWLRAGVKDGAGALMQLKKFNQAKREGAPKQGTRRTYRQLQVREKMPEWSKQDQKQKTKKASPEAIARARALQRKHSGNR